MSETNKKYMLFSCWFILWYLHYNGMHRFKFLFVPFKPDFLFIVLVIVFLVDFSYTNFFLVDCVVLICVFASFSSYSNCIWPGNISNEEQKRFPHSFESSNPHIRCIFSFTYVHHLNICWIRGRHVSQVRWEREVTFFGRNQY